MIHICQCGTDRIVRCDDRGCLCVQCGGLEPLPELDELSGLKKTTEETTTVKRPTDHVTDLARHAGRVRRYHTWVVHHQQSVGEHCWQVALVYEQIFGVVPQTTERFIRHHDTPELVVGDPPFPVKAEDPILKARYDAIEPAALMRMSVAPLPELITYERAKVKICDLLEMMCHGMTEREMGNLLAVPIVIRTERVAQKMANEMLSDHDARAVRTWVRAQWARHEAVLQQNLQYSYSTRSEL